MLCCVKRRGATKAASDQDRGLVKKQNFNLEADVNRTGGQTLISNFSASHPSCTVARVCIELACIWLARSIQPRCMQNLLLLVIDQETLLAVHSQIR